MCLPVRKKLAHHPPCGQIVELYRGHVLRLDTTVNGDDRNLAAPEGIRHVTRVGNAGEDDRINVAGEKVGDEAPLLLRITLRIADDEGVAHAVRLRLSKVDERRKGLMGVGDHQPDKLAAP